MIRALIAAVAVSAGCAAATLDVKDAASYRTIKAALDVTPVIDMHDHLPPFDQT